MKEKDLIETIYNKIADNYSINNIIGKYKILSELK